MATDPTFYKDATSVTARALETTGADFVNGMNAGSACAPGIGINIAGGAVDVSHFSLEDQHGAIRVPQDSQQIGGSAYVNRSSTDWPSSGGISGVGIQPVLTATNQTEAAKEGDPSLDGVPVITGDANLQTLSAGWVDTTI
jgi:hypothetical protein